MRMSTQERLTALAKLTPDKQLEMYFYGQRYEPPANFQFYIAPNWRSLLPVVKQRFASESSEKKLANMVALLTAISITQCSLVERRDLLELASRVVAKMQDHPYKEWAAGDLNTVTHPTKQLPPCQ